MKIVRKKTEFHKGGPGPLRPTRSYSLTVTTHRQLILSISKFRFNTFHFKESVDVTTFAEEEFSVNQTDVFGFPAEFLQKKRWKTWMNWSKAERYLLLPCILEQWWKLVLIDNIIMVEIGFRSCSGNNDLDPVQEIMILKRNIYILCENSKSHRNVCALRQAEQI